MQDEQQPGLVGLSAEIVSAYVAKNHIQTSAIPQLIASVHDALRNVAKPAPEPEKHKPPVPINKTIRPDYIISLEDGRREAPFIEPRPYPGAISKEVGSATRLSDGRLKLHQGSIRVGEGDWSRPKEERSEAGGQERHRRLKLPPSYLCPDLSERVLAITLNTQIQLGAPGHRLLRQVGGKVAWEEPS